MDLPTTDPGSDLCDLTDSADENFVRSEGRECEVVWNGARERREELVDLCSNEVVEKGGQSNKTLILPEIVRPRSMSFGELLPHKDHRKTRQRTRCLRTLRNPSPVSPTTSREARIKLTSLRQQIWTGVPSCAVECSDAGRPTDVFARTPLSWGVSRHALMHCPTDGDVTLRSQSKKLQLLAFDEGRDDVRKTTTRRRSRRKRQGVVESVIQPQLKEAVNHADGRKSSKKKSSRIDWQRAVNFNSRLKDARGTKTSFLTIEADSLKLLTASTTAPKPPSQLRKNEPHRKFRSVGAVASTCASVLKTGGRIAKSTPRSPKNRTRSRRNVFCCESTTSDDASSEDEGKVMRVAKKKKQKKKKQQQLKKQPSVNRGMEQRKRASSAKTSR